MNTENANHIIQSSVAIRGDFDVHIVKCDADGNPISEPRCVLEKCQNLITNTGMDRFGTDSFSSLCQFVQVGTGTTAPANTDTNLVSRIASQGLATAPTLAWDTTNPKAMVLTGVYTFLAGPAAGVLAELGLSSAATGTLTTRALFMSAGSPTTVTVLSDEQLIITYRLYFTASETDSTLTTTQKGTSYTLTLRPSQLGVGFNNDASSRCFTFASPYNNVDIRYGAGVVLGSTTSAPSGGSVVTAVNGVSTLGAYTSGNYYRDDTLTIPLSLGNVANAAAYGFPNGVPFRLQVGVSPPVSKTSGDTITFTVRASWTRG